MDFTISNHPAKRRLLTICQGLLWLLVGAGQAISQSLPLLDQVRTEGLSPLGYKLDSYRWNKKDGLPDLRMFAFLQDHNGLMWMSFDSGLFSFDGFAFRAVETVNRQLGNSRIIRMAADKAGHIWLLRSAGDKLTIDILQPVSQQVTPLHAFLGQDAPMVFREYDKSALLYNLNRDIWFVTGREIYRYDGNWQCLFRSDTSVHLEKWMPADNGFWLPGTREIQLLDRNGNPVDRIGLRNFEVRNHWLENDLSLWVGIGSADRPDMDRYLKFVAEDGKIAVDRFETPPASNWQHNLIHPGLEKKSGYWLYPSVWEDSLYLGFRSAPLLFNLSRLHPSVDYKNLLYFDREGGLWTTTVDGIIRLVLRPGQPFVRYLADTDPAVSTRGIALHRGKLLVNSDQGARLVDLADGSSTLFDYPYKHLGLALLCENPDCWITRHRLPLLRTALDAPHELIPFERQIQPESIFSIHRTPRGDVLAATEKGIFRLDESTGQMVTAGIPQDTVGTLFQDGEQLWAGTSDGLLELDAAGTVLRCAYVPPADCPFGYITHIHRDKEGLFWMTTHGGGLIRWNPATGEDRIFTTADGLSHKNLHAVYPDSFGHLWIPSDYGLMRFDKTNESVQTFFREDGIADNEFNLISHFRTPDGRLFLGGINGITSFDPDDIRIQPHLAPPPRLMEVRSFDLHTGSYSGHPLPADTGQAIRIHPSDAFIELDFSPLRYERADHYRFSWRVEGLQQNWFEQASPIVRLSNLPYGRHRLLVRLDRQGAPATGDILAVPIYVVRPFWLDWPFLLLLALTLSGTSWLYTDRRTRKLAAANLLLEQEVNRRTRQIETDRQLIARQAAELRSLDEMKSRFFANVTHEFKTPLTLILGPLERLLHSTGLPKALAEGLLTIRKSALRLQQLADELLELSKMEAGKLGLDEQPVVLHPFLVRLLAAFLPYAEHRGIRLQLEFRLRLDLALLLDSPKCEKIINNLLSNALKFTPGGGSVTITVLREAASILILVEDTGPGIDADDLPFIFDRYYQGQGPQGNRQGGTGIGLALCREYACLLGGDLTAESTPGTGSLFRLSFPHKPAEVPAVPPPLAPDSPPFRISPPAESLEADADCPYTILIVEDDVDLLRYIRSCFGQTYRLLVADNGLSALRQLEKAPVDLILSDLMMPEMDGFQLMEKVKEKYPGLPFVLLTARVDTADRLQALRLGVDDYLTKPFVEEELTARIHNLLQRYDVRQSIHPAPIPPQQTTPDTAPDKGLPFDQQWLLKLETEVRSQLMNQTYSVHQMAEHMNVSLRTLQNKLVSYTGMTPRQYLMEARLTTAKQLLEKQQFETVAEVCFAVGLKTPRHFAHMMKERFGKSPSEY